MKRLRKGLNNAGFSLAETLLAVLILLLVSVIVATGMPAVRNAYEKIIVGANAQTMLSTAVTSLRDELGTAWEIRIDDNETKTQGTSVTYYKADTGARAEIYLGSTGAISVEDYKTVDLIHDGGTEDTSDTEVHLVSDTNSSLFVTYTDIEYNPSEGLIKISGLRVCPKKDTSRVLAKFGDDSTKLEIRVLSVSAASGI